MRLETEAAFARVQPAGALPDPSAGITLGGLESEHPWRSADMGRESSIALRQRFPLWGKRGLARDIARQQAEATGLDRDDVQRTLLAEAEAAYVDYWHADQAIAVIDRRLALLQQIEELASVRYALGQVAQQDAIRAQVAQTAMQRERITRLSIQREAIATLNSVLGRSADAPLAAPRHAPELPFAESDEPLHNHPALLAQQARADAARSDVELQRRNRWPDVMLGAGLMRRDGGFQSSELMLEIDIPLQQRARREREREARLMEEAAQLRSQSIRRTLEGQLARARVRWADARERRELTERRLLPQADAAFHSALASYRVGEVDFSALLDGLDQWQGADLDRVDAVRDELLAAAAARAIEGDSP